jgi:cell division protein FtsW (lipid II flippase)
MFPSTRSPRDQIQSRLLRFSVLFLFLYSIILTLSPAVRLHSWQVTYRWSHWIGFGVWVIGFALIHRLTSQNLPDRDPYLLPLGALLSGWGLLTIWRLDFNFGLRQSIWLAFALVIFGIGLRLPNLLAILRRFKYIWLTSGILLTALTIFFGVYPGGFGPHLWLGCCGVYLQPSEPLKLLLVIYLAAYLADQLPLRFSLLHILMPTLILVGAAMVILVAQRDLGTATLFLILYFTIVYLTSGRKQIPWIAMILLLIASLMGYLLFGVIRIRINAWVNPWADSSGSSYQIVQSLISVAAGKVFGRGPGLGSPSVVPVTHSDFIFTAITEEMGMVGGVGILLIQAIFIGRSLLVSLRAPNNYQRYLSAGLALYICVQSILIIGGNIRLLPLTGVTLPFVSYGGSSLVTSFISLLLICLISNQEDEEPASLPSAHQYQIIGTLLLMALFLLSLLTGWWSAVRSEDLLTRLDNPRRFVNDRYALRGSLLDRKNEIINLSKGEPGSYQRVYTYPPLSLVTGYTHPVYGQAGLEASTDAYLRGVQGNPSSLIWTTELLYGQPPQGLNVRLSIDIDLQKKADELLGDQTGAVVLLNARSGEILAMASHPYFDANQLDEKFEQWSQDSQAPLLNRATFGQYPPGATLGTYLIADTLSHGSLPSLPKNLDVTFKDQPWNCALPVFPADGWNIAIQNGCPGIAAALGKNQTAAQLLNVYQTIGFTLQPDQFPLPLVEPINPPSLASPESAALGQGEISVSPLQMALAAAAISSGGTRPSPILTTAVDVPSEGWVILTAGKPANQYPKNIADETAHVLAYQDTLTWHSVANAQTNANTLTWYIGGSMPEWKGSPLAIAVLLEKNDPTLAAKIGNTLLQETMAP